MPIIYQQLTRVDAYAADAQGSIASQLSQLMQQLSDHAETVTVERLNRVLSSAENNLIVAIDTDRAADHGAPFIVGTGSLITVPKLSGVEGRIEALIVDNAYRGQGIASAILQRLIANAQALRLTKILLTSKQERIAAHALYRAFGFEKYETCNFSLML